MAKPVSSMASTFISVYFQETRIAAIIDGSAKGLAVQLKQASTAKSGIDWKSRDVQEITLKNLIVHDQEDISFLVELIQRKVKIVFSKGAHISPDALDILLLEFKQLKKSKIKVVEGSQIRMPILNECDDDQSTKKMQRICQQLGFKITQQLYLQRGQRE